MDVLHSTSETLLKEQRHFFGSVNPVSVLTHVNESDWLPNWPDNFKGPKISWSVETPLPEEITRQVKTARLRSLSGISDSLASHTWITVDNILFVLNHDILDSLSLGGGLNYPYVKVVMPQEIVAVEIFKPSKHVVFDGDIRFIVAIATLSEVTFIGACLDKNGDVSEVGISKNFGRLSLEETQQEDDNVTRRTTVEKSIRVQMNYTIVAGLAESNGREGGGVCFWKLIFKELPGYRINLPNVNCMRANIEGNLFAACANDGLSVCEIIYQSVMGAHKKIATPMKFLVRQYQPCMLSLSRVTNKSGNVTKELIKRPSPSFTQSILSSIRSSFIDSIGNLTSALTSASDQAILSLSFSPNGKFLAALSSTSSILLIEFTATPTMKRKKSVSLSSSESPLKRARRSISRSRFVEEEDSGNLETASQTPELVNSKVKVLAHLSLSDLKYLTGLYLAQTDSIKFSGLPSCLVSVPSFQSVITATVSTTLNGQIPILTVETASAHKMELMCDDTGVQLLSFKAMPRVPSSSSHASLLSSFDVLKTMKFGPISFAVSQLSSTPASAPESLLSLSIHPSIAPSRDPQSDFFQYFQMNTDVISTVCAASFQRPFLDLDDSIPPIDQGLGLEGQGLMELVCWGCWKMIESTSLCVHTDSSRMLKTIASRSFWVLSNRSIRKLVIDFSGLCKCSGLMKGSLGVCVSACLLMGGGDVHGQTPQGSSSHTSPISQSPLKRSNSNMSTTIKKVLANVKTASPLHHSPISGEGASEVPTSPMIHAMTSSLAILTTPDLWNRPLFSLDGRVCLSSNDSSSLRRLLGAFFEYLRQDSSIPEIAREILGAESAPWLTPMVLPDRVSYAVSLTAIIYRFRVFDQLLSLLEICHLAQSKLKIKISLNEMMSFGEIGTSPESIAYLVDLTQSVFDRLVGIALSTNGVEISDEKNQAMLLVSTLVDRVPWFCGCSDFASKLVGWFETSTIKTNEDYYETSDSQRSTEILVARALAIFTETSGGITAAPFASFGQSYLFITFVTQALLQRGAFKSAILLTLELASFEKEDIIPNVDSFFGTFANLVVGRLADEGRHKKFFLGHIFSSLLIFVREKKDEFPSAISQCHSSFKCLSERAIQLFRACLLRLLKTMFQDNISCLQITEDQFASNVQVWINILSIEHFKRVVLQNSPSSDWIRKIPALDLIDIDLFPDDIYEDEIESIISNIPSDLECVEFPIRLLLILRILQKTQQNREVLNPSAKISLLTKNIEWGIHFGVENKYLDIGYKKAFMEVVFGSNFGELIHPMDLSLMECQKELSRRVNDVCEKYTKKSIYCADHQMPWCVRDNTALALHVLMQANLRDTEAAFFPEGNVSVAGIVTHLRSFAEIIATKSDRNSLLMSPTSPRSFSSASPRSLNSASPTHALTHVSKINGQVLTLAAFIIATTLLDATEIFAICMSLGFNLLALRTIDLKEPSSFEKNYTNTTAAWFLEDQKTAIRIRFAERIGRALCAAIGCVSAVSVETCEEYTLSVLCLARCLQRPSSNASFFGLLRSETSPLSAVEIEKMTIAELEAENALWLAIGSNMTNMKDLGGDVVRCWCWSLFVFKTVWLLEGHFVEEMETAVVMADWDFLTKLRTSGYRSVSEFVMTLCPVVCGLDNSWIAEVHAMMNPNEALRQSSASDSKRMMIPFCRPDEYVMMAKEALELLTRGKHQIEIWNLKTLEKCPVTICLAILFDVVIYVLRLEPTLEDSLKRTKIDPSWDKLVNFSATVVCKASEDLQRQGTTDREVSCLLLLEIVKKAIRIIESSTTTTSLIQFVHDDHQEGDIAT